jgi:hypothetical protein
MNVAKASRAAALFVGVLYLSGGCVGQVGPWEDGDPEPVRTLQWSTGTILPVPFVTQKPNEKACTAATLAMVLRYYGVSALNDGKGSAVTAQTIYDWFSAKGYLNAQSGYVDSDKVPEGVETLSGHAVVGEVIWWSDSSMDVLRDAIDWGYPCMLFTYHNKLPGSGITKEYGHNITVYGYSGDTFHYYNPYKWNEASGAFTISSQDLLDALMANVHVQFSAKAAATESCHQGAPFDWSYCSADCPCGEGEGDCDHDGECDAGLVCKKDVGANYGASAILDVCETPAPPPSSCHTGLVFDWSYCSVSCPCGEGEGDCDSDDECDAGLTCAQDVGASYGVSPSVDVCTP